MAFGGRTGFPSCTPAGIMRLLDHYEVRLEGADAVVIGRSPIFGKPLGMLLLHRNATVTYCHSRTKELAQHVRRADVVVAAVGIPNIVRGSWLKSGSVVIDAGYNEGNVGDVALDEALGTASLLTPVRGGVGPMRVYDYGGESEWNVTATNARSWQLDAIAAANVRMQQGG